MNNNPITRSFIEYTIKTYAPEIDTSKIQMNYFREATIHISMVKDIKDPCYERLEYLGDSIFHLIVTEYLYLRYDDEAEGFLTKLRIRIERGDSLAEFTDILGLDSYIQIKGIPINNHILEDVFEAFIGAFYLNFGFDNTKTFVISLIENHKNLAEMIYYDDNYKDLLLRYFHQMKWGHPIYLLESRKSRLFTIIVKNPFGKIIGRGSGSSKKIAEQKASEDALVNLGIIIDGEVDPDWMNKIDKIDKESKEKSLKKSVSVFNKNNILIKKSDIIEILKFYNVKIPNLKLDINLFYEAMTHRSYLIRDNLTDEDKKLEKKAVKLQKKSNERLQFLGDAVIHFVVTEIIYHKFSTEDEGFLTRLRCKLENRERLFYLAQKTNIDKYILISQIIEIIYNRSNVNIISGGLEAFIGSLYLQIGLKNTKELICEIFRREIDISKIAEKETNYKDMLLQLFNKKRWGHPEYRIIKEEGPDHNKIFYIGIYRNGKLMARGKGSSKKKAEQSASKALYDFFMKN